MRLSDHYPQKRAFVTGAASGFGLALCKALAREGWTLGLADVNESGLEEAATLLRDLGGRPVSFILDVSDIDAFERTAASFIEQAGGVDVVINNAGIGSGGLLEETSLDDWNATISINLMGVVHGCLAFVPHLKRTGSGHLINVASIAAVAAGPYMAAYNTAKAGVLGLTETLYSECKDAGVRVSVVLPSFFKTNIATTSRGNEAARKMTEILIRRAEHSADEVAAYTLTEAGKGTLHIIYPRLAKRIWHWKRLLPMHYLNSMVKSARRTAGFVARVDQEAAKTDA